MIICNQSPSYPSSHTTQEMPHIYPTPHHPILYHTPHLTVPQTVSYYAAHNTIPHTTRCIIPHTIPHRYTPHHTLCYTPHSYPHDTPHRTSARTMSPILSLHSPSNHTHAYLYRANQIYSTPLPSTSSLPSPPQCGRRLLYTHNYTHTLPTHIYYISHNPTLPYCIQHTMHH